MRTMKKLAAVLAALALLMSSAMAEVIVPTGNTYGFAGTNGKYYTDYNTFAEEQLVAKDLAIEEATEGFVMLKNENNVLPLKKNAKVSLFGMHAVSLVASTVGSAGGSLAKAAMLIDRLIISANANAKIRLVFFMTFFLSLFFASRALCYRSRSP